MNIWKKFWAPQLWQNYRDTTPRGHGNKAARRAIATARGREHIQFIDEPIYTERPEILKRGFALLLADRFPERRDAILGVRLD